MANLTPEEILRISEPVEQIYSNVVDALLVNLAKPKGRSVAFYRTMGNTKAIRAWKTIRGKH